MFVCHRSYIIQTQQKNHIYSYLYIQFHTVNKVLLFILPAASLLFLFAYTRSCDQATWLMYVLIIFVIRDEPIQMKPLSRANGCRPFSSTSSCSAPSSPCHPVSGSARPGVAYPSSALTQSPAHKPQTGGVRKVTGVGGTTYEISV